MLFPKKKTQPKVIMVEIMLPDLSSPSVSTHHLLVGCQRREEEQRGVKWERGRRGAGWQEMDGGG